MLRPFAGANKAVDAAIGGWQFDFIVNNQGGTPIGFPNGSNYNCGATRSYPHTSPTPATSTTVTKLLH
jgi:hypothetical protein